MKKAASSHNPIQRANNTRKTAWEWSIVKSGSKTWLVFRVNKIDDRKEPSSIMAFSAQKLVIFPE